MAKNSELYQKLRQELKDKLINKKVLVRQKANPYFNDKDVKSFKLQLKKSSFFQSEVDKIWEKQEEKLILIKEQEEKLIRKQEEKLIKEQKENKRKEIIIFKQGMEYILENEKFKWHDVITSIDPKLAKGRFNFDYNTCNKVIDSQRNSRLISEFFRSYGEKLINDL